MEKKILDYCVESNLSLPELVESVNSMIKAGYEPQGGLFVLVDKHDKPCWYFQAMIKRQ